MTSARKRLKECDDKLNKCRQSLEAGTDPANADPEDRKAVYSELNLAAVYHDDGRMQVSAGPDACTNECVGGGTCTHETGGWRAR